MTHGQSKMRLYAIWRNMRERCNNPRKQFAAWHGRGIKVCTEWEDFTTFREWALSHGYAENLSIDRIDNNKGYCPENCRWVTWDVQLENRGNDNLRQLTAFGRTQSYRKWSKEFGVKTENIRNRIYAGWSPEDAVSLPVHSESANNFKDKPQTKDVADKPEMRVERMKNGRITLFGAYGAADYLGMPHQEIRRIVLNILNPPPRVRKYMEKVRRVKEAYPELFKGVA